MVRLSARLAVISCAVAFAGTTALASEPDCFCSDQAYAFSPSVVDPASGLSVSLGLRRNTFTVGDQITLWMKIENKTTRSISGFHEPATILLRKADGATDAANFGFDLQGERIQIGSFRSNPWIVEPGEIKSSAISLNNTQNVEAPGAYEVEVVVYVRFGPDDHRLLGTLTAPVERITVLPKK